MTSPQEHFADLTALLEDLHGLAVEGQHPDLTEDISKALSVSLTAGLTQGKRQIAAIRKLPWSVA
ncbi:MAG: hypothetical protein CL949_19890 [Erythrobacter sp.]|nr:hypothetical protein [Erythrobacter sp.]|tara:strand:- start:6578 stop:6772 length:195 start_codon:yes stop_codon:yes gene_type:complete